MGYYNPYVTIGNIVLYIPNNLVFLMLNYSDLARWFSASTDTPKQEIDPWNHFIAETIHHYLKKTDVTIHILKLQDFFLKIGDTIGKIARHLDLFHGISHMFLFQCQPTVVNKLMLRLG